MAEHLTRVKALPLVQPGQMDSNQTKAAGLSVQHKETNNHTWSLAGALREDLEVQVLGHESAPTGTNSVLSTTV